MTESTSPLHLTISTNRKEALLQQLSLANHAFQKKYPGARHDRQPVHTVYGGAHLFKYNTAELLGKRALETLATYAPDFLSFGRALHLSGMGHFNTGASPELLKRIYEKLPPEEQKKHPARLPYEVYYRVIGKLEREAVEDFRIDFEDGYGHRPDEEEDDTAVSAALEMAKGMREHTLPPFIGIRLKPLTEEYKERALQTLDLFISTLVRETGGRLPQNFVVMLPKVTIPEQPKILAAFFEMLEEELVMEHGVLKMEMMVETTQSIMDSEGTNPLYSFVEASNHRCVAMHFGTYDYTASAGIIARYQEMDHPACDFAHYMTKVALAHTGIWISDGTTNTMPIGPNRGDDLTMEQEEDNTRAVHRAWRKGYDNIRHSLWNGLYQGWDLNPAQLPMRYAAVYSFFLESYDDALERLRNFIDQAAKASLVNGVLEDASTGQGLLNFFLRAWNSGAISEAELLATGLTLEEIRSRSFKKILENRMGK